MTQEENNKLLCYLVNHNCNAVSSVTQVNNNYKILSFFPWHLSATTRDFWAILHEEWRCCLDFTNQKIIAGDCLFYCEHSSLFWKLSSLVTVYCVLCWCGVWWRAGDTVQCWQAGQARYQLTQAKHWQFPSLSLLRYITPASWDSKQSIIIRSVKNRCMWCVHMKGF